MAQDKITWGSVPPEFKGKIVAVQGMDEVLKNLESRRTQEAALLKHDVDFAALAKAVKEEVPKIKDWQQQAATIEFKDPTQDPAGNGKGAGGKKGGRAA